MAARIRNRCFLIGLLGKSMVPPISAATLPVTLSVTRSKILASHAPIRATEDEWFREASSPPNRSSDPAAAGWRLRAARFFLT
jgi:hypothetical protein